MIIDKHLARTVISSTLTVMFVLLALTSFVSFIGEYGDIGKGSYDLQTALTYVLLSVPQQAYLLFPVAALLGAMLGLGGLAAHNELMVMRTAGVSIARLGGSVLVGGLAIMLLCAALGEFIAAPAQQYASATRAQAIYKRMDVSEAGGIWARDGETFVNVRRIADSGQVSGIYIFRFDSSHRLQLAGNARTANFKNGAWHLQGLHETVFSGSKSATIRRATNFRWPSTLSPSILNLFVVDTDSLSARGLYGYVQYLHANGLDARRYEIALWSRFARPVSILVMVFLALPFVFGPLRSVSAGQRLLVGILIGVAFYVINATLAESGAVFGLNPLLAAWGPTLLLGLATLWAVRKMR